MRPVPQQLDAEDFSSQAKRRRTSGWDQALAPVPVFGTSVSVAASRPVALQTEWADVFSILYESSKEPRAGEFAEAIVGIIGQVDSAHRQLADVREAHEQLFHSA